MGITDKAKRAGAALGIASTIAQTPTDKLANTATTNREAKQLMERRAAEQASRLRGETNAKGNRDRGSSSR
ncbi:hypothetical protein ACNQR7_30055 [Mycolicibacterium senegalense]|uniref:hypothetical protein n=1 Tax=Mycolicibacterium senegalense TaxID=1796 RepID=UPI003AACA392